MKGKLNKTAQALIAAGESPKDGDVRKVRGVYQAMEYPTKEEAQRVIDLQRKYAPVNDKMAQKHPLAMVRFI